jgi:hypothetical protein
MLAGVADNLTEAIWWQWQVSGKLVLSCRTVSPWTFHVTVVSVHFVHCAVAMIHDRCDT